MCHVRIAKRARDRRSCASFSTLIFSSRRQKTDGAVRRLVTHALDAGHECWVDDYVVIEARRNLQAKGRDALSVLDALLSVVRIGAAQVRLTPSNAIDCLPEKDRPVLAAAINLRCAALVTGDQKHFGTGYGKVFGGVMIHSPRSFAALILR